MPISRVATSTVFPVVRTVSPVKVRLVAELVNVALSISKSFPNTRVLPVTSNCPPVGVPPAVKVRVLEPAVSIPVVAGDQALATVRLVEAPRFRSKLPISRVATSTVFPVVRVVSPVKVRLVAELVNVALSISKSFPNTRVLLVRSNPPPVGVPPPVKVRVLVPGVMVPVVAGDQTLATVRLVAVPRSKSKLPISKVATSTVFPVVRTVSPVKVRLVDEEVKAAPLISRSVPNARVLPVTSNPPPVGVPPPVKVRVLVPGVMVPVVAGDQALATVRLVEAPRSRSKLPISKVATSTVLPVVRMVLAAFRVRLVAEEVNVPAEVSRSVPRIKVPPDTSVVPAAKVPPLVKVRVLVPVVRVPFA